MQLTAFICRSNPINVATVLFAALVLASCDSGGSGKTGGATAVSSTQSSISSVSSSSSLAASSSSSTATSSSSLIASSTSSSAAILSSTSSSAPSSATSSSSSSIASSSSSAAAVSSTSSSALSSSSVSSSSSSTGPTLPVTEGLVLRLDASSLSLPDGALVGTWPSLTPALVSAEQANDPMSPVYVASSINGRPAVRFDGVDDRLLLSSHLFANSALPLTAFVVTDSMDYRALIIGSGQASSGSLTSEGQGIGLAAGKVFAKSKSSFADGVWLLAANELPVSGVKVIGASVADSESRLVTACQSLASASTPTSADISQSFVGGSVNGAESFAGDLAEVLVYNRVLSDQEFNEVRDYLALRYGADASPLVDSDLDGWLDACDGDTVFLASPAIDALLEFPATLNGDVDPVKMINKSTALEFDRHFNSTHVYHDGGDIVARIDLNAVYNLSQLHFWNYTEEAYDADTVTIDFYDIDDQVISQKIFSPQLGFENILAEDLSISVNGVSYLRLTLSGSNSQTEFMNIGFTGVLLP